MQHVSRPLLASVTHLSQILLAHPSHASSPDKIVRSPHSSQAHLYPIHMLHGQVSERLPSDEKHSLTATDPLTHLTQLVTRTDLLTLPLSPATRVGASTRRLAPRSISTRFISSAISSPNARPSPRTTRIRQQDLTQLVNRSNPLTHLTQLVTRTDPPTDLTHCHSVPLHSSMRHRTSDSEVRCLIVAVQAGLDRAAPTGNAHRGYSPCHPPVSTARAYRGRSPL